jgi:hypothetical protein
MKYSPVGDLVTLPILKSFGVLTASKVICPATSHGKLNKVNIRRVFITLIFKGLKSNINSNPGIIKYK